MNPEDRPVRVSREVVWMTNIIVRLGTKGLKETGRDLEFGSRFPALCVSSVVPLNPCPHLPPSLIFSVKW